jgi:hypothetical protein
VECFSEAQGDLYAVTVATIRGLDYESEFISKRMGMANARLVASSPELLVAVKALVEALEGDNACPSDNCYPGLLDALELADKAIAKAEGRGE